MRLSLGRSIPAIRAILFNLQSILALALLVLGVLANHHNTAFAANNLALLAHGLHGRSYLHKFVTFLSAFCVLDFAGRGLFAAPGDPATGQVVGRHLHRDLIAGQNPDEIHSELSGNMR